MIFFALLSLIQIEGDLPRPALAQPIRAACMIEVAGTTGDAAKLTQDTYRLAAENKANKLSSLMVAQVRALDDQLRLWPQVFERNKDLFDNKLITQKEWDDLLATAPEHQFADGVEFLRRFSNCRLLENMNTPAAKKMKEAVGQ